jgi:DNA-binding PadR family transcriptional regulator
MFRDRFYREERFFHGFRHDSPFGKGDLKYVILDLLKEKARYGYDIIRSLEDRSGGFYKPSPGVVYPTLQMLEEMGYASSEEKDGKKVYTITDKGMNFLKEKGDLADEIRKHMKHHWNPENFDAIRDLMGEVRRLGRYIGPRIRTASPEKISRIRKVVSKAHNEIESIIKGKD